MIEREILQFIKDDIKEIRDNFKEFRSEVSNDFKTIKNDVELLLKFKWQIVSTMSAVSIVITILIQAMVQYIQWKK